MPRCKNKNADYKSSDSLTDYQKEFIRMHAGLIPRKRCPETAKEFIEYEYERDKEGQVISGYPDKDNHSIDAVRYALEEIWRRRGQ